MSDPIEPAAVIPAGWPFPTRSAPAGPPPPPPYWPPAVPYGPAPAPEPRPPAEVRVTVDAIRIQVTLTQPEPDPPTWAERLQLRRNLACCAIALAPATGWGSALHQCWQQAGLLPAWIIAGIAIGAAGVMDQRRRGRDPSTPTDRGRGNFLTRIALCTALLAPALGLPITGSLVYAVTGVAP